MEPLWRFFGKFTWVWYLKERRVRPDEKVKVELRNSRHLLVRQ